ncbi:MAG: tRNA (N6-isopentenyl adenosine(37)-C2)-methylthiotransferase MiaB, partial [Chloroflexi bacterium]|nr:tRNA (N6-isopentenyl adenosine(37)-C2)-methylthiotransferase MiaB [Chloroflexota bacterium]
MGNAQGGTAARRDGAGAYYLWTIGCQMNFADMRKLGEELQQRGYHEAARPEDADVVVLQTCVVRQSAEERALGRLASLKPLKRRWPDKLLVVAGCLVGEETNLRERFPYVDLFLPPATWVPLLERLAPR